MQFVSIYLKGVVRVCVPSEEGGALSTILLQIYTFFMEKNAPKLYSVHNKFFLHLNRCFQYSQQFSSFILNIFLCLTRTIISVNNGEAIKVYCHKAYKNDVIT